MLDDVEILRSGDHTAKSGQKITITDEDLAAIAAGYDPAFHEAPVVIGHPADNQPAYGWVKGLKAAGGRLFATLDLVPEFVEAVRQGLFKKRSASIYPNLDGKGMYLRHVGFLGAMPPAVKALADINLSGKGDDFINIEFMEGQQMSWKDKVKQLFGQAVDEIPETGTGIKVEWPAPPQPKGDPVGFSEEDVKRREEAAAKKAKEEAALEFAERQKQDDAKRAAERHKADVQVKINDLVTAGKVTPALVKTGLAEFMEGLAHLPEAAIEFAEGKKQTPYEYFCGLLAALPKAVEFGEKAGKDKDFSGSGAAQQMTALVAKKLKENRGMAYMVAFSEVQTENPDLARQYLEEVRR